MKKYNLISIIGPTASGKTSIAANLAYKINGEILSADSRQVYIQMTIGTGKDYKDYIINNTIIKTHLIDLFDAGYKYNVFEYQKDFFISYNEILKSNKIPILCGGTGLYIESILKSYNLKEVPPNVELRKNLETKSFNELKDILKCYKKIENNSDFDSKKRAIRAIEIEMYNSNTIKISDFPTINSLIIGVKYPREIERKRIFNRLNERADEGMIQEVEKLLKNGLSAENLIYYGLEYKYITQYLTGKFSKKEMLDLLYIAICQFSKRQMTWFRKMERNGFKINWLNHEMSLQEKVEKIIFLADL